MTTTCNTLFSTIIAIDPGATGGVACWKRGQPTVAFAMPDTDGDLIELLPTLIAPAKTIAYVERVGGFVGKAQPGSRMFAFGRSYGFVLGALQAMGVRIELVLPQKWQKPLGLGTATACASRTEWKSKLKAHAQRLFPGMRPTLKTADALLILDYALKSSGVQLPCP